VPGVYASVHSTLGVDDVGEHQGAHDDEQAAVDSEEQPAGTAQNNKQAAHRADGVDERERDDPGGGFGAHDEQPDGEGGSAPRPDQFLRLATHRVRQGRPAQQPVGRGRGGGDGQPCRNVGRPLLHVLVTGHRPIVSAAGDRQAGPAFMAGRESSPQDQHHDLQSR